MKKKSKGDSPSRRETQRRRSQEERDRMAGNATAAAERFAQTQHHKEMSAEEKLQERTDELMRRLP